MSATASQEQAKEPECPDLNLTAQRTAHVQALCHRLLEKSPIYGIFMTNTRLISVTPGCVTSRLILGPTHVNSKGSLHGAVSATIIDFTTGLAIASWDLRETTGVSVDMHISYLSGKAGLGDELEVVARAEKVGGSLAFVTVRIDKVEEDGGRTAVTMGQHTKFVRQATKAVKAGLDILS